MTKKLKTGWNHNSGIFIGYKSISNMVGGQNVFIGSRAGKSMTGDMKQPVTAIAGTNSTFDKQICDFCGKPKNRCQARIIGRKHRPEEKKEIEE